MLAAPALKMFAYKGHRSAGALAGFPRDLRPLKVQSIRFLVLKVCLHVLAGFAQLLDLSFYDGNGWTCALSAMNYSQEKSHAIDFV